MNITLLYVDKPFEEYEHLMKFASEERQYKIQNLKSNRLRSLSLLSHLLARNEISLALNIPFSHVELLYNQYGKPYVDKEDYHFSISHSGSLIAFTSCNHPVGIDVQEVKDSISPALRFFTENEQEYVSGSLERFFEIWTKKEAYVKMLGSGLSTGFASFDVLSENLKDCFFTTQLDRYFLSLCTKSTDIQHVNIKTVKYMAN